jgi:hypothetical protein
MTNEYTEQDSDRVRAAEREQGSAGMPTQSLGELPPQYANMPMAAAPARRNNNLPAIALLGIGIVMLLANLAGRLVDSRIDLQPGLILFTISSCFLFFSFWKRIYGLLIPGCILAGVAVGATFADLTDGVSVLWGLSLGFFSILFLGRSLFNQQHPWPAIPGVILFAVGTLVAMSNLPGLFSLGLIWLPLALIGAGLYLGWGRR